jgi:hypothetical protein
MRIDFGDVIWAGIFVFIIAATIGYAFWIRSNNNSVKVIDNCEYIQHYNGHGWDLVHKGNCTNSVHYKK